MDQLHECMFYKTFRKGFMGVELRLAFESVHTIVRKGMALDAW